MYQSNHNPHFPISESYGTDIKYYPPTSYVTAEQRKNHNSIVELFSDRLALVGIYCGTDNTKSVEF